MKSLDRRFRFSLDCPCHRDSPWASGRSWDLIRREKEMQYEEITCVGIRKEFKDKAWHGKFCRLNMVDITSENTFYWIWSKDGQVVVETRFRGIDAAATVSAVKAAGLLHPFCRLSVLMANGGWLRHWTFATGSHWTDVHGCARF